MRITARFSHSQQFLTICGVGVAALDIQGAAAAIDPFSAPTLFPTIDWPPAVAPAWVRNPLFSANGPLRDAVGAGAPFSTPSMGLGCGVTYHWDFGDSSLFNGQFAWYG